MFHNYETEKITRKASDTAENLQELFGSSTRDRHESNVILWMSADIMRRAWRSRVEEPNNLI